MVALFYINVTCHMQFVDFILGLTIHTTDHSGAMWLHNILIYSFALHMM